ncbi:MAG: lipopolysaccharide heptosyltransferase II [Verrucomicrobiales bacterium]|nr:lipopolysaccharide heptosyltransferase II [Verrucomicrobiales bacterium]
MNPKSTSGPTIDRTQIKSLLIRGVNWLGDAVMTTPAISRIREHFPEASITLLCPEKLAELWWQHPAVDEVLMIAPHDTTLAVARHLRTRRFDLGIVLPNSFRSAWELWLSRIPRRVGYSGNGRSWLLTHASPRRPSEIRMRKRSVQEIRSSLTPPKSLPPTPVPASAHHIYQYLHLAQMLGALAEPLAPSLRVSEKERQQFQEKFLASPPLPVDPTTRWIGLNPGAEYGPAKRWPAERFAAVATEMAREGPCVFILFGGGQDETLARSIGDTIVEAMQPNRQDSRVIPVAGKTTLRELMAGLSLCDAVLTNDTGPMHVAAALGTPVVVPFGSTSAALTGPGSPDHRIHRLLQSPQPPGCSPCFLRECPIDFRCMTQISVSQVANALREASSRSSSRSRTQPST